MPSLPLTTARAYALAAGFKGSNLDIILAIAQAESSLNPLAVNKNIDGSFDRGIVQINNRWHPEVSDSDAYNPQTAFGWAFKISSGGTDFTPWSTYQSGAYKQYLSQTTQGGQGSGFFADNPDFNWLLQSPDITLTYVPHWARDVQESTSWPLTALVPGTVIDLDDSGNVGGGIGCQIFIIPDAYPQYAGSVIKADWKPSDGGVDKDQPTNVDVINQPKYGRLAWYSYHFLPGTAVVKNGDKVLAGQKLAMTGYYGHPDPENHAHTGWFYNWVQNTDAGWRPYGPDILPYLQYLVNVNGKVTFGGSPPSGSGGVGAQGGGIIPTQVYNGLNDLFLSTSMKVHYTLVSNPGLAGIVLAVDEAEQFPGIVSVGQQAVPPPDSGVVGAIGTTVKRSMQSVATEGTQGITQDISSAVQSMIQTVAANTLPAVVRGALFLFGATLLVVLIIKASRPYAETAIKTVV